MPKMMKKVQQMSTMLPIGRSDDSSVCTTSFRPLARLMTLHRRTQDNAQLLQTDPRDALARFGVVVASFVA